MKKNITQYDLAKITNLTYPFINDIKNCKKWISPDTISRLCNALKVEPLQFFLSDNDLEDQDKKAFAAYMDDLSSSIVKSVNEFKTQYLGSQDDDS